MDLALIVGLVLAFAMIFVSVTMEGGDPMAMFFLPPMLLVIFSTLGAALGGGTMSDCIGSFKAMISTMTAKNVDSGAMVTEIVTLAERARREGLLALEDAIREVEDPFLRDGLQGAVDGTDPEELQDILYAKVAAHKAQGKTDARLFADMGGYAPTVGIIGTVFGLIHVLENLDKPETLGHSIAAAFVATLWGVMSANLIWLPIANRIKRMADLEVARMELAIEGISSIQAGANPRVVSARLASLLPPAQAGKLAA